MSASHRSSAIPLWPNYDPNPNAVSCYGLYLPELEETWLRFVDGR
jgi:hypothetical protein